MFAIVRGKRVFAASLMILFAGAAAARADTVASARQKLHEGYYVEHVEGNLAAAADLYDKAAADPNADHRLRAEAKRRLATCREELATADFAALVPETTLIYMEVKRPGDQLLKLLEKLGLLAEDGRPAAGGRQVAISPSVVKEILGIRGMAVAITGIDLARQKPSGVAIFHPGNLEILRGLIETGLPIGGRPVEPIGGFPTYDVEGEAFVTLTSRLVVASPQRSQIEAVLSRLNGERRSSLATNAQLVEELKQRDDSLVYFCANARQMMPMITGMMAAGAMQSQELALAQAVLDLNSLRSLTGHVGIGDDGIFLDVAVRLDDGHQSLVYNLLRTPPINWDTMKCIPEGAAAFVIGSLNETSSRYAAAPATSPDSPPVVTALDFGRELFANITGVAIYALPPDGPPAEDAPPMPDVAAAISVHDPSKSRALWMQLLGVGSLASGAGAIQGPTETVEGVEVSSYRFPEHVTISFATVGNDVLIASSKSAMARSIRAKRSGKSVVDDPAFAKSLKRLSPASTKAVFLHAGRCAEMAKNFAPPSDVAEMEPFIRLLSETVASLVIDHSAGKFQIGALVSGIPEVGPVVAQLIEQEQEREARRSQIKRSMKSSNWDEALGAIEAALAEKPGSFDLLAKKFKILAVKQKDRSAATTCADAILQAAYNDATALNNLAWALLTEDQYGGEYADVALKLSERSNELTGHKNWMFVDTLALAKFETGDVSNAVALEKKAVELAHGAGGAELQKALARFENALNDEKVAGDAATD